MSIYPSIDARERDARDAHAHAHERDETTDETTDETRTDRTGPAFVRFVDLELTRGWMDGWDGRDGLDRSFEVLALTRRGATRRGRDVTSPFA